MTFIAFLCTSVILIIFAVVRMLQMYKQLKEKNGKNIQNRKYFILQQAYEENALYLPAIDI